MSSRSESSRAAALREGARKEKSLYEDTADEPGTRKRKGKQAQGGKAPKKNKESQEELEPLDIEWLESDLKNSYVTQMPGPEEAKPGSERKKYKPHDPAITDLSNVPRGWTHVDDDIHPDDYEAQVERCLERLEENIMPIYFEERLKEIQKAWEDRDARMKAYPDLSWPVVQRVETLEKILKWLPKEDPEDEWQQLENLKALMKAYKDKSLDWTPGLVTYWSKGFKLCEPRPWEDEEFMHINVKHKGHTGFWVEGLNLAPEPDMRAQVYGCPIPPMALVTLNFTLRFPSEGPWHVQKQLEMNFADDTGSTIASVYSNDLTVMQNLHHGSVIPVSLPPAIGIISIIMADSSESFSLARMLEINMRDPVTNSMLLDTWTLVPCIVRAPNGPNSLRLSGNWMRRRLYTYTAPDMTDRLWIHTDRPLVKDMPKATANQRRAPLPSVQQSLVPLANYPTINTSYPDGIPPRPPRAAP